MRIIFLIALALISTMSYSADIYQTNTPNVYIKNFSCSGVKLSFNVVNKSASHVSVLYLNVFDEDGDPIDKKMISRNISSNSGKADTSYYDCNKLQRVGFSTD